MVVLAAAAEAALEKRRRRVKKNGKGNGCGSGDEGDIVVRVCERERDEFGLGECEGFVI